MVMAASNRIKEPALPREEQRRLFMERGADYPNAIVSGFSGSRLMLCRRRVTYAPAGRKSSTR